MSETVIRPLREPAEARLCAAFLSASEPWITLGITAEMAYERLMDSTREVHLAFHEERIAGVLSLFLAGPLNGYIQLLAVAPEFRRRGIGRRLVAFAEDRIFPHSPNVFLCVSSFNHEAQALYARLGYERVGELPDFVVKGHSEILLRKTRGPLLGYPPVSA
ncbi:MAG: GNAT family N-acetyltransferase [Verrucomicrobiota bacterium]